MSGRLDDGLVTPVYVKRDRDAPAPADPCYYLLTADGLFIGRNLPTARSLVPAPRWPGELGGEHAALELRLPQLSAELIARAVGFFWCAAVRFGGEAGMLLYLDRATGAIRPLVPRQTATVGLTWRGEPYPVGLHYEVPRLGGRFRLVGDIHSHAFEPAYASTTDVRDEQFRPGLHVVAGRLNRDPPQWHAEYVVDGTRFELDPGAVMALDGYAGRAPVPRAWMKRLGVENADYRRSTNRS